MPSTSALVSIIIPTYNRAALLMRTLDTVLRQTHVDWEAIVVDDGSTDGTADLFSDGKQDARIRYVRQQNAGVSAARNRGIREARGEFVAFLDSDDLWRPWKVALQVQALCTYRDVGMVWTDMEAIDADDAVVFPRYLRQFYSSYQWFTNEVLFPEQRPVGVSDAQAHTGRAGVARMHVGHIYSPMLTGNLVHTSTSMITRTRLNSVGGFDESISPAGEDYEFHLRTCRDGAVGFIDVVSTSYRVGRQDQLTQQDNAIYMAEQFLRTVATALAQNPGLVDPQYRPLIARALSEGHVWAAYEHRKAGHRAQVRRHLQGAIRRDPRNLRPLAMLAIDLMPDAVADILRAAYQAVSRRRRDVHLKSGLSPL